MQIESARQPAQEILKRFSYTIILLLIVRITIFIPLPGIDNLSFYRDLETNTVFSFINNVVGGGAKTIGVGSFGISPYFNATLTIQALIKLIPEWERLQKEEGELGRRILIQRTRYITLIWSVVQSFVITLWIRPYVFHWTNTFALDIIFSLTTGSILIMWIAELISQYGLGNGSSFLVMVNIVTGFNKIVASTTQSKTALELGPAIVISVILFLLMIAISIFISEGKRKIKILSSRQLGTVSTVNSRSYLPLKLNAATIIPIVIGSIIVSLPIYLVNRTNFPWIRGILSILVPGQPLYLFAYYFLVVGLNFFYTNLLISPKDITDNLTKLGVVIPGIRPGTQTIKYLDGISKRLGVVSATLLCFIGIIPYIFDRIFQIPLFRGLSITSLLIFVGVSIEIAKQVRTYLLSQSYEIERSNE